MGIEDVPEILFILLIIITLFWGYFSLNFFKLYSKRKKSNIPLTSGDMIHGFDKNPYGLIKQIPLVPFIQWKVILFESQDDKELAGLAKKARIFLMLFLVLGVMYFFISFLIIYFNL